MKTLVFILLALVAATGSSFAQQIIAIQNGSSVKFAETLDYAIKQADNGDTLYLPGGMYPISVSIDKKIHIIGNGHNLNFTPAGGETFIAGDFYLSRLASNGSVTGVYFLNNVKLYPDNGQDTLFNYFVSRCNVGEINYPSNNKIAKSFFIENIFRSDNNIQGFYSCSFFNNIIQGYLNYKNSYNIFKNNIFLFNSSWQWDLSSDILNNYSRFENNIFFISSLTSIATGNYIFYNNLFIMDAAFIDGSTFIGSNNIGNQTQESIFTNQTGNTFNYTHDYHLKETSPGKNAGRDGTDIGIYGGKYPWKEGSIPFNPHFESIQIAPNTVGGNLNVNIKVAAQER